MIEGITSYDKNRLAELGIHSCHDLAEADFIPLMLKSSYGARQLTAWILQAKLCVYCGEAVKELRQQGIRNILDLEPKYVNGETLFDIADLAMNSSATESNLKLAQHAAMTDPEIRRLRTVAKILSQYTTTSDKESVQAALQKTESEYLASGQNL